MPLHSKNLQRCFSFVKGHYPVMWENVLEVLEANLSYQNKILVGDGTLGGGGHSRAILEVFPNAYVVGTDLDKETLPIAQQNTSMHQERISVNHSSYTNLFNLPRFPEVFPSGKKFDAVLLDLGLSSFQLDSPGRGFSFKTEGKLDMRFNQDNNLSITAEKFVNFASELELAEVFKRYGEEKHARQAAEVICQYREEQKITTTTQLSKVLNYAFFLSKTLNKYDSITRCFQALRIKVNNELENVSAFMDSVIDHMEEGGVVAVVSFHSLEDNIVKRKMKELNGEYKADFNCWDPILPSVEEFKANSRSRSARMRYMIKKSALVTT